ncbi:MAG TPA: nicotinate-nucleotide--dimethylbenzimidazole phosphoribosyltransferase [Bryobacteraceae bacterium]|jgi:nicotinate-nucleotide--dimethylbenzimidazole phosphoribosyltransferase|nr:nicotinate-nucleotide--dimethylbenzimidazole phosphoribosyltransferase [Bryobacteraceae bacterium]
MNLDSIRPIADAALETRIRTRLDSLTKPPGSLGRLEDLVVQLGLIQATEAPQTSRKAMIVFCADHGVVEEGVSPYPSEVTRQMVANFRSGGAAINVLCRHLGLEPVIVDMGVGRPTRNFAREPAMTRAEAEHALDTGFAYASKGEILGAGEMGIGNTTSAAALFSAFSGLDPTETAGRGTGLDDAGVIRKIEVVRRALALHRSTDPIEMLAAFGGFEIAAITGLILGAASRRHLVMLDGFITGAAAIVARVIAPAALDYVMFSHCSAEKGHKRMLEFLNASPLLNLEMRLGEGTGAALGIGLLESAVNLYREMATFQSAGVSTSEPPTEFPSSEGR